MSVIELDYDVEYKFDHDFVQGYVVRIIKIKRSDFSYKLKIGLVHNYMQWLLKANQLAAFQLEYSATCGTVTKHGSFVKNGSQSGLYGFTGTRLSLGLLFKNLNGTGQQPLIREQEFTAIGTDLRVFIERGPNVTLVGNDGTVIVPKRLLELRSEALEMILNHDSKEKQTNTIELKDFDSKTLCSFEHFLKTKEIKDGTETATGLILLGDKYNIQVMKSAAEQFVKNNIESMDRGRVIDVLSLVNKKLLEEALINAWSN